MDDPDFKFISLRVARPLCERVEAEALRRSSYTRRVSVSELYRAAILEYLDRVEAETSTALRGVPA